MGEEDKLLNRPEAGPAEFPWRVLQFSFALVFYSDTSPRLLFGVVSIGCGLCRPLSSVFHSTLLYYFQVFSTKKKKFSFDILFVSLYFPGRL